MNLVVGKVPCRGLFYSCLSQLRESEFLGSDLTQLTTSQMRQKRRQLQMVFQDPHACLNPLMTVGKG